MEQAAFLSEVVSEDGFVAVDRLSAVLRVSHGELAHALGVAGDSLGEPAQTRTPAAQARLRDMVEIINRVHPWAGSLLEAFLWYRSQCIPAFGDQTAEALVKRGQSEAVKHYLDAIAVGGYA